MRERKQLKSELMAAPVTPEFMARFDRAIQTLEVAKNRSQVLRFLVEKFVQEREAHAGSRIPTVD